MRLFGRKLCCTSFSPHSLNVRFSKVMDMDNEKNNLNEPGHDLSKKHDDPFIEFLHCIIRFAVKVLAVLIVLVIVWGHR